MPNNHRALTSAKRSARFKGDHLSALGDLVGRVFMDATQLFEHGLGLLVQELGVDRAFMTRLTDLGYEVFWWKLAEGVDAEAALQDPGSNFCPRVLDHPARTLVIRDAQNDPVWRNHSAYRKLGVRAYVGVPLHQSGKIIGVLSVQHGTPRMFSRAELSMVNAVANLFSKTLEVETLKQELHLTRDALDLTTAVVEDSALENPATGLPNRHYMEIWLKVNLYSARRRGETLALVVWQQPLGRENKRLLREVAQTLRGEDLLVNMKHEEFCLLMPHTTREGAQTLLDRIRGKLGPIPMGASTWNPLWRSDREDLHLHDALHRAFQALRKSQEQAAGGQGAVEWDVPEPALDDAEPC